MLVGVTLRLVQALRTQPAFVRHQQLSIRYGDAQKHGLTLKLKKLFWCSGAPGKIRFIMVS
eukprot:2901310-Amphidinium_carterae.1